MYLISPPIFYRSAIQKIITRLAMPKSAVVKNAHTQVCIRALTIMLDIVDDLICRTRVSRPFLNEFLEILEKAQNPDVVPDYALADYPVVKIECMACMMREYLFCNRKELQHVSEIEAFLRYFEKCGEWEKDDGKTVTRYYFYDIPQAYAQGHYERHCDDAP
jgi:hypothetical protein